MQRQDCGTSSQATVNLVIILNIFKTASTTYLYMCLHNHFGSSQTDLLKEPNFTTESYGRRVFSIFLMQGQDFGISHQTTLDIVIH